MRFIFLLLTAIFSFANILFAETTPRSISHEGAYYIGEFKQIPGVEGCTEKAAAEAVFRKLPDLVAFNAEYNRLRSEKQCGIFMGGAFILGQIGSDVRDADGARWRIVHIRYINPRQEAAEAYLLTWGDDTIITERFQRQ